MLDNSNGNIKTPRSVGSLPSLEPSLTLSLLDQQGTLATPVRYSVEVGLNAGRRNAQVTGISNAKAIPEPRRTYEKKDERLALRAERYHPANRPKEQESKLQLKLWVRLRHTQAKCFQLSPKKLHGGNQRMARQLRAWLIEVHDKACDDFLGRGILLLLKN